MGRPAAGLDEYLDWQQRLESQKASGLSIDLYCLREGVSKTTFYRWANQLRMVSRNHWLRKNRPGSKRSQARPCSCRSRSKRLRWRSSCPMGASCDCPWALARLCSSKSSGSWARSSLEGAAVMTTSPTCGSFCARRPPACTYSFDRLMGLAQQTFKQDPLSGHLFLFVNRDRDRIKILFWDRDGFCIWYKKLESHYPHFFALYRNRRRCR